MARYFFRGEEITKEVYEEIFKRLGSDPDLRTGMDNRNGWSNEQVVHESNQATNMEGGVGVKMDEGKPQMSLLPLKDLEGVVRVLEFGAKKYARGDWKFVENGAFRYLDAGLRHGGELSDATTIEELRVLDHESGLPAIDHAICSLIFARHFIFKEK